MTPGPDAFPPAGRQPAHHDGRIVLNASLVMNASGTHDAVVDIDAGAETVTLKTPPGSLIGATVSYLRLDASADVVAALEESVLAPNLGAAPGAGSNAAGSSRSAIVGLQSAVLEEGSRRGARRPSMPASGRS